MDALLFSASATGRYGHDHRQHKPSGPFLGFLHNLMPPAAWFGASVRGGVAKYTAYVERRRIVDIFRALNRHGFAKGTAILSGTLETGGGISMYASPGASAARPEAASRRRKHDGRRLLSGLAAFVVTAARPVGLAFLLFLTTFVRWFGMPSPFAAAFLLARGGPQPAVMLLAAGASLALRALWGLELDVWQYVGLLGLWLLLKRCRPRPGIETAALGGWP